MIKIIETYHHDKDGYNPFFIRAHWQVAQLNYMQEQGLDAIAKMDMHLDTDEVFVLTKGAAVLIAGRETENEMQFEAVKMRPGMVYNIPAKAWHNIAMDKEASVIIVEKSNTHLGDFICRPLNGNEQEKLSIAIQNLLES